MPAVEPPHPSGGVSLSIVIITRNEAANIARSIEALLRAVEGWPQAEIVLVDSASTDATVEIARRYPINIVRLPDDWFLSVPAGRLIGMHYTRGDLVVHMDGDMELEPDWIGRAATYAWEHPEAGAVGGYWRNVYIQDGKVVGEEDEYPETVGRPREVRYVGGAALYRRVAIEAMGGFQPFIKGEEGVGLCMGIRQAGYKVVRLPYLMSRHYCVPPQSLAYNLRRMRRNMYLGYGQYPRYYLGTGMFWTYLKERGDAFLPPLLAGLVGILAALLSIFTGSLVFMAVWLLLVLAFVALLIVKKRSLRKALVTLFSRLVVSYSAVRGFMIAPRSPAEYPTNAEIVQVCFHRGGFNRA